MLLCEAPAAGHGTDVRERCGTVQAVLREAVSRTRENGLLGRMARALLPAAMAELDGGYAWHKPVFTERERKGLARPPWYKPD